MHTCTAIAQPLSQAGWLLHFAHRSREPQFIWHQRLDLRHCPIQLDPVFFGAAYLSFAVRDSQGARHGCGHGRLHHRASVSVIGFGVRSVLGACCTIGLHGRPLTWTGCDSDNGANAWSECSIAISPTAADRVEVSSDLWHESISCLLHAFLQCCNRAVVPKLLGVLSVRNRSALCVLQLLTVLPCLQASRGPWGGVHSSAGV